jgi:hypothetical protein
VLPTNSRIIASVFCCLVISITICAFASDQDPEEKMMWKGSLSMESVELHQFNIFKSTQSGTRSHSRNHETRNTATVYISAADILQSGDIQGQGTREANIDNRELRKSTSKSGRWGRSYDTFKGGGTAIIKGSHVRITIVKKAAIDSANAIQEAIGNCGADPACLSQAMAKFQGLIEDSASSFPVKIVATILTPVKGRWVNHSISTSFEKATGEKRTEDGPTSIDTIVGGPMLVEMDGTYTRGEKGDTITAHLSKTEILPYKSWDGENHPRENRLQCSLHLTNGPPEVRIYVDTTGGQKDITDKETKVMVGQRVHLTAHVASTGLGEEIVTAWHIPDRLFSDWLAWRGGAKVKMVEDLEESSIHFAWIEGSLDGWKREIRYDAEYAGKSLTGKTTFLVFSPGTDVKVEPGTHLGRPKSGACGLVLDPQAITLVSRAMMPANELDCGNFTLQYVQLVRSNSWGVQSVVPKQYYWVFDSHDWLLDTTYPYNAPQTGPGHLMIEMTDSPFVSLREYDSVYMDQQFETHLMFKPPRHPELETQQLFVPLYKVDWRWKGAVQSVLPSKPGDPDPGKVCFQNGSHLLVCAKPPAQYSPVAVPWQHHPEWTGATPGYDKMRKWLIEDQLAPGEPERPGSPSEPLPRAANWSCN